jgi:purine-binding chemotaxis protein CheW
MTTQTTTKVPAGKFLTFDLDHQTYGLPIDMVREIFQLGKISPVPGTPPYIAGVMNLRGKVIPIADLRVRLGLPKIAPTKTSGIIVVESPHGETGVIVDGIQEVVDFAADQIDTAPIRATGDDAHSLVSGIGKQKEKVTVLLDLTHLVVSTSDVAKAA